MTGLHLLDLTIAGDWQMPLFQDGRVISQEIKVEVTLAGNATDSTSNLSPALL